MFDILTPKQMSAAEQASVKLGISLSQLMDNAGESFGRAVLSLALKKGFKNIVILVGSGNNGGDGLVCANFLAQSGVIPTIILMCGQPKTELAIAAFNKLDKRIQMLDKNSPEFDSVTNNAEIIADCVFGTGFHGKIADELLPAFSQIGKCCAYKITCDLPSGVNALNGAVSPGTIKCSETITFHRQKLGTALHPAKEYCGKITLHEIGIPDGWETGLGLSIEQPDAAEIFGLLPVRRRDSHKGSYGKLMLICGSEKYMGAALISSSAALRSGIGIANLCTPKSVAGALISAMPECIFTSLKCDDNGFITADNLPLLLEQASSASAIVLGCGIGVTDDTAEIVYEIIKKAECPIILDADGINCLSGHIDVLEEKQAEIILTPHPAELARLCGKPVSEILDDRLSATLCIAQKYGVTVHAKGTQTMTVTPENRCYITDFGNSALAKGGSGDMLAGLIGSFIAQGKKAHEACLLASCLMGMTAENLSLSKSERGLLARDIISAFPDTLKQWEQQ